MDTQKFKEIINAYAAGCLDREDYPALLEFINSGNPLDENALGKLQNVITLLPAILEIEHPGMRTKDKVARKLYRLREEVRTKRKPLEIPSVAPETKPEVKEVKNEQVGEPAHEEKLLEIPLLHTRKEDKTGSYILQPDSRKLVNEVQYNELNDKAQDGTQAPAFKSLPEIEKPLAELNTDKTSSKAIKKLPETKKRGKGTGIISIIVTALIFSLLSGGAVFYLLSIEVKKDNDRIAYLTSQVNGLTEEFAKLEKNQRVLALLGARDTRIFSLDGTVDNTKGFGKIIMSSDGKDGVLQLYNMPALKGNENYKLWAVVKDQSLPMGIFRPRKNAEYFPIDQIPAASLDSINTFTLTLEQGDQTPGPSKNVFLAYTIKTNNVKK